MRVLFVTNRYPGQLAHGDQLRAWQQIRHLSTRHEITLLTFDRNAPPPRWRDAVERCCERVIVAPRSRLAMAARALAALPGRRPLQVAMHDALPDELAALVARGRFDVAHVALARLDAAVDALAPLPCVVDFVDALSLNMARRAALDRVPWRWLARLDARRLPALERALCGKVAFAAVCSATDRAAIGDIDNLRVVCNGVDLDAFAFAPYERRDGLVFVGNLGYFPNVDAVTWFAGEVLPLLPAVRLTLVGANPSPQIARLARHNARIELVGPVPDVHPYLARAAVAIVPLRAGSGQQLKMIEAMASGTPVVATSLSAAGLEAVDGEHALVADDGAAMAAAVERLMSDPAFAARLARQARRFVEARHGWERSASELEKLWTSAARAGSARP
ncbi:glycosyltransferase family 4 protein [Tahibacter soli]|uniref:Glycosyltransferase family 4 protein n=1 Tax=Tahibacter soli TaxID=2983605 RepID=A0A9X4BJ93_9GAMM|nr:glycosyltransferase family 4 protein [Tahibacter soli]MDC8014846.1 glycosyltransferase family 4 protein [Tahibacter soli]